MTSFKRAAGVAAVAALLVSSTASYAADVTPLPAGKAAGTHEAALLSVPLFWIGLVAVGLGIGFAVSGGHDHNTPSTTSTTTTTGTSA